MHLPHRKSLYALVPKMPMYPRCYSAMPLKPQKYILLAATHCPWEKVFMPIMVIITRPAYPLEYRGLEAPCGSCEHVQRYYVVMIYEPMRFLATHLHSAPCFDAAGVPLGARGPRERIADREEMHVGLQPFSHNRAHLSTSSSQISPQILFASGWTYWIPGVN